MQDQETQTGLLSQEEIELIQNTAKTPKYADNPVPESISSQFTQNITDFVHVTHAAKGKLAPIYGTNFNYQTLEFLQADWEVALQSGAIRLYRDTNFCFPTHVALESGEVLEVTMAPDTYDPEPYYLAHVPDIETLTLMRDAVAVSEEAGADESAGTSADGSAGAGESASLDESAGAGASTGASADGSADTGTGESASLYESAGAGESASVGESADADIYASADPATDADFTAGASESAITGTANTDTYTGAHTTPTDNPTNNGPVPPFLADKFEAMKLTNDYQDNPIPTKVYDELCAFEGDFEDFARISQNFKEDILACADARFSVLELLNRDWRKALETKTIRYYEGKVLFPISILRKDGERLVEVSLKQETRKDLPGTKRWYVNYINSYVSGQANSAGRALTSWAFLGEFNDMLEELAEKALPEKWATSKDSNISHPVLLNYLNYTFYRLQYEGKILEDTEKGIAAFNTGLVDKTYEPIYACFSASTGGLAWRFETFCRAGSRGWGKRLVSAFNPLPARAEYFQRKEDLLFDTTKTLERDVDHILIDNIDRLPREFLDEELRNNAEGLALVDQAFTTQDQSLKRKSYEELRGLIEDEVRIKRRLINRLDDAIDLAKKRVEWNYKTAVPAYYPAKNTMSLLLPLDLTENDIPDVALVVELVDSGVYMGQTILTMEMAYKNARLISRPDSDWLNTTMKLY